MQNQKLKWLGHRQQDRVLQEEQISWKTFTLSYRNLETRSSGEHGGLRGEHRHGARRPAPFPLGTKADFGPCPFLAPPNLFPLRQLRKGTLSKLLPRGSVGPISSAQSGMVNMAAAVRCLSRGKAWRCVGSGGKDRWCGVSSCTECKPDSYARVCAGGWESLLVLGSKFSRVLAMEKRPSLRPHRLWSRPP